MRDFIHLLDRKGRAAFSLEHAEDGGNLACRGCANFDPTVWKFGHVDLLARSNSKVLQDILSKRDLALCGHLNRRDTDPCVSAKI